MQEVKARAHIDLSAIVYNAEQIKRACYPAKFCAVVKSDAYGHGCIEVANAISNQADLFAVCSVDEGVKLRLSGVKKPILCLLPQTDFLRAHFFNLTLSVSSEKDALNLLEFCKSRGCKMDVHLAINTGMNRFGLNCNGEVFGVLPLFKQGYLRLKGVYSHFYKVNSKRQNDLQLNRFNNATYKLKNLFPNALFHLSSGGGLAFGNRYKLDMVRVGLMLYGYNLTNCPIKLKPAMTLKSDFYCQRQLSRGDHVLYGNFKLTANCGVWLAPFGYFNGLSKGLNGQFNNCAMNVCALNCKNCGVLMDNALKTAKRTGKSCYEVLTSVGMNNPRVYYYGDNYENNCGKI